MNLLAALLALSPVIVILLLLTLRRTAADMAGLVGWAFTVAVASLPIALVAATSILQVTGMIEVGVPKAVLAARCPGQSLLL